MKKADMHKKLTALGVKVDPDKATFVEMRALLKEARTDKNAPGHNIHEGPQPGDRI